jgi:hypothetical protein
VLDEVKPRRRPLAALHADREALPDVQRLAEAM